jgi:hypothetical protein
MSLYKFCQENCIAGASGALVEVKRGEFVFVGKATPKILRRLQSACIDAGGKCERNEFYFNEVREADGFAAAASRMGVEVHTLKTHVEMLASYLQTKKEYFKTATGLTEIAHPETPIMVLDPLTRRWKPSRLDDVDKTGHAVLCDSSNFYIAQYYKIFKVSKEDAYLFALLYLYREKSITVIMDESGTFIGVKLGHIGDLPESVFFTLVRLQPALRKGASVMMFYRADLDTVFSVLRLAKLSPIIATGIVRLAQKLGEKEVPVISPRVAPKEAGLLSEVLGTIGYTVKYRDQYLEVEREGGPIRIYLANSAKHLSSHLISGEKAVLVPVHHLFTPDGTLYTLKMIRTYGFSLITTEQWARVLEKLCELAEGDPNEALELAAEALLMSKSKPEIYTAMASNPALKKSATNVIERAVQGSSGTPLDKLPMEELIGFWRRLRQGP